MGSRHRLKAAAQVTTVAGGTAIYSLCQWAILIVFARATSPAIVGAYSYALAMSAPFFILFSVSLRQVYVTDNRRAVAWPTYLQLRVISSLIAFMLTLALGAASTALTDVYLIVALIKAVDLIADIYLAPAQARGNVRALGVYQAINGVASLSLFAIGVALGMPAGPALAMSLLGSCVAGLYALAAGRAAIQSGRVLLTRPTRETLFAAGRLALVAAPLGVAGFLNSVSQAAPRFMLERESGLELVGLFGAMAYLVIAGNTLVSAVIQYELPRAAALFEEGGIRALNARTGRLTVAMTALGAATTAAVWAGGTQLVVFLYGPGYDDRTTLTLLTLSWAVGATSWVWDMALVVRRDFVLQMVAALAGMAVSVVASVLMVGQFGLSGAGWASLAASLGVAAVRLAGVLRQPPKSGHDRG